MEELASDGKPLDYVDYWFCEKCKQWIVWGTTHVCPLEQPVSYYPYYQPNYQDILERIEQSLLRIEKILEKEL